MKLLKNSRLDFLDAVDQSVAAGTSVVGRYLDTVSFEDEEGKHIRKRSIIKTGRGRG